MKDSQGYENSAEVTAGEAEDWESMAKGPDSADLSDICAAIYHLTTAVYEVAKQLAKAREEYRP